MTDRLKGLTVFFDRDIREDDAKSLIDAIKMLRYVADVQPVITNLEDTFARKRVRDELKERLWGALQDTPGDAS